MPSRAEREPSKKPVAEKKSVDKKTVDKKTEVAHAPAHKPEPDAPPKLERALRARDTGAAEAGMERFRIEVGHEHGVKPGNIVGAIANEAEIESEYIGRIEIFDDYSTIQLPEGMPKEIFKHLKSVWVSGQRLQISRLDQHGPAAAARPPRAKAGTKKAPTRKKSK